MIWFFINILSEPFNCCSDCVLSFCQPSWIWPYCLRCFRSSTQWEDFPWPLCGWCSHGLSGCGDRWKDPPPPPAQSLKRQWSHLDWRTSFATQSASKVQPNWCWIASPRATSGSSCCDFAATYGNVFVWRMGPDACNHALTPMIASIIFFHHFCLLTLQIIPLRWSSGGGKTMPSTSMVWPLLKRFQCKTLVWTMIMQFQKWASFTSAMLYVEVAKTDGRL